ncbi:hypothetical protein AGMMS49942_21160 [Spirochaetia bacterium]|nr:hypothetical protein AGMMS49942_21160 [Spirochaetia bacterium]
MKNSKVVLGMLVLVLAFGFVMMGCEQTVGQHNVASIGGIDASTVTAAQYPTYAGSVNSFTKVYVDFDAIEDATSYNIYLGNEDHIIYFSGTASNGFQKPAAGYGTGGVANETVNKTKAFGGISVYAPGVAGSGVSQIAGQSFYVGVQAKDAIGRVSDVEWTETALATVYGNTSGGGGE